MTTLDYSWHLNGRDLTPGQLLQGLAVTTVEDQLSRNPPHRAGLISAWLWCLLRLPLECVICGSGWVVLPTWSEAFHKVCCLWELPGGVGHGQPLPVFYLGPSSMSYKAIFRWLLFLLRLEVPGEANLKTKAGTASAKAGTT